MATDTTNLEPLTVSVKVAAELTGLTKWGVYKKANDGEIETRYSGSRRLVVYKSLLEYIENLPTERPEAS
jgi:hypothetical protein